MRREVGTQGSRESDTRKLGTHAVPSQPPSGTTMSFYVPILVVGMLFTGR